MKKQLLTFLLLCIATITFAQPTAYWRGGTGNYNDPTKWSNVSGGAPSTFIASNGGAIPVSGDNIVFDNLSAAGAFTVTVPVNMQCLDMLVTATCPTLNITVNTGFVLQIYGNTTVNTDNFQFSNTAGTVEFYDGIAGTQNINILYNPASSRRVKFMTAVIFSTGDHLITNVFKCNRDITVKTGNTSTTFNDSCFQLTSVLNYNMNANSGIHTFNKHLHVAGDLIISSQNTVNINTTTEIKALFTTGNTITINGAGQVHRIGSLDFSLGSNINANFSNSHIKMVSFLLSGIATNTVNFTNSSLHFYQTLKSQFTANPYFASANIRTVLNESNRKPLLNNLKAISARSLHVFESDFLYAGNAYNDTYDSTFFYNGNVYLSSSAFAANKFTVNQYCKLYPGVYLQTDVDASQLSAANSATINVAAAAAFVADAPCSGSIRLRDIAVKFVSATPSYTCNGLVIDNSRNIGATLNAGLGSYKIPGSTTTGWAFGATPTPRILRWTGTATPTSFYQYKRWHQSASWQNVTTGVTPECPPTIFDSVIFPNNSFVRIDEPNSVCHGMNWQGTGTFYDSTYATIATTVAIAGHWAISPANTGVVMYNKVNKLEIYGTTTLNNTLNWWFNGRVYFRAWEPIRFLFSGQRIFRNVVAFDATSDVGGWLLTDSLYAHYSYEGQYGTGANIVATTPLVGSAAYSLWHLNGHLNTNGYTVRATNYVKAVKTPEYISSLTLQNSKMYIMGITTISSLPAASNFCVERSAKFNVNAGTSEIIFRKHLTAVGNNPNPFFGGGYKYNNLTFKCNRGGIMSGRNLTGTIRAYTDTFNIITFERDANIYASATTSGSFAVNVPPLTENIIANQIHFNTISGSTDIGNSWTAGVLPAGYVRSPLRIMANSVIYYRNANVDTTTITYNNLSVMSPGMIYNFYYSRHIYPATSVMQGLGLCSNPITLNKGIFFNNSGADFESSSTNLTSFNVGGVISSGTDSLVFLNSIPTAALSGKAIVRGGGSRILVWRDNTAGVSAGNWNDQSKWALATITSTVPSGNIPFTYTVGSTGQCVPNCIDTVIFDAASFDANDIVHLPNNYTGYFHTMRWATGLSVAPTFSVNMRKGAKLNICGSLYLQNNLTFNNNAYTLFTGSTVNDTIDALGKSVCNYIARFESSANNVNWTLKSDALFAPNSFTTVTQPTNCDSVNLQLVRGHLNLNGKLLQTAHFCSMGSFSRKLSLPNITIGTVVTTSTLNILGGNETSSIAQVPNLGAGLVPVPVLSRYQYAVDDGVTNTFTLNAAPSSLLLFKRIPSSTLAITFAAKYGNNQSYGRVVFEDAGLVDRNGMCFNTTFESMEINSLPTYSVIPNNHAFGSSISTYTTNYYNKIKKLTSNNKSTANAFNLFASGTLVDSLVCEGGVNILDTTAIKNYYKFVPGATYKFPHNRVTYLYDKCDFKPIGLPAQTIILLSTLSGTKAWIRKDTSIVCADYCSVTDNWMIGSGLSMPVFGTGGSFPGGNGVPIAACTATPGPWRCDTVLASSYYTGTNSGPTLNANPSQGFGKRCIFNGGTNFTIGPNTFGWEKTPNPPSPHVAVVSPNVTLCEGDSVRITFTFIGTGPFQNFNYFYNTNSAGGYPIASQQTVTASSTIGIPSYTASPNYTLSPGVFPGDSIKPTDPSQAYNTFGTPSNPWVYSFWVYPTQSIKYNLGTIAVDRCFNSVSITGTGSMVVTVNPAPKNLAAASLSNPICNNATAVITSTATQTGNNYYLYTAPTGTTGITLMNSSTSGTLTTGTYTTGALTTGTAATTYSYYVGAESQLGCPSLTRTPVTVTVNPTATVQIAATSLNPICDGQISVITVTTNATTGVQMYNAASGGSLLGTLSSNSISISPAAGSYTYYLQANNSTTGCNATGTRPSVTLTVNPTPVMTSATNTTICSGSTLNFALNSNVAGSIFQWLAADNSNTSGESTSAQSTSAISDAVTNNTTSVQQVIYNVVPTGTAGACPGAAQTVTVTINPTPMVTSASTATICSGTSLNLGLTSNVASTYTWVAASNSNVAGESTSNQTTNTINNTLVTSVGSVQETVLYTITPQSSAGACLGTEQTVTVTVNSSPSVTAVSSNSAICSGNTATLTASGANTYAWTSGPLSSTYTVTNSGTYSVVGTNTLTGCTNTTNVSLLVNPTPTVSISASSGTICSGQTATLTAATANSYAWSTTSTANTTTVMPTGTTVYTVTGTNTAGSCTATAQFTVSVNSKPDIALTNTTTIKCLGDANGTATVNVTSGTSGYTYVWTGSASTSSVATALSAGPHTVQVTDAKGCKDTLVVNIAAPSLSLSTSVATATTGCSLSNGTATLTPNGGWNTSYTYVWQSNASTTNTATGFAAGTYTAQVTDANGCVKVQNFTISNPSTPTIAAVASNPTICSGLSTTITPSGAVSYSITGGAVSSSTVGTSFTVNPAANTTYSIIGTDASNCISTTATVAINVNTTPTVAISATNNTICIGNSSALTLTGATTYTLLNTNASITSGASVSPTTTTTYSIQGTTGTCTSSATQQVITVNTLPVITATTSAVAICSGNTATLTAGGASSYVWTSGPSTPDYVVATAGIYTVTGTDANTCVNTQTVSLSVNALPIVTATASSATICAGNTATLTAGGAITYTWSNPSSTNTVVTVNPTSTTNYVVTGTDGNNCVNTETVTLTVNQLPTITASTITNVSCFGANNGSVVFTPAAGTPTYAITGSSVTGTTSATGLAPADYTYTVTDAAGCVNTTTVSITEPTAALLSTAAETATNTSCTSPDGVATVTITGGTGPSYTITSSPGTVSGNTITGLGTGIYSYTVTDQNNCKTTNTGTITGATGISSTLTAQSNVLCFGNNTASVSVLGLNEAGGTYTYTLTNTTSSVNVASNNTGIFTNLPAGSYSVNILGGVSNCVSSQNITITQPTAALNLTGITANSVVCNGGTALATATITGGTGPYTYVWASNTNTTTTNATSSVTYTAGNYSVDITDANGCVLATQNFTIHESPVLSIASVATTTTGCELANGTATINANGGWSSYTYTITDSGNAVVSNTTTATGLTAGTYTADVIDALGCATQTVFTITNPSTPTISIASSVATICAGETTTLNPTGAVSYTLTSPTTTTFVTSTNVSPVVTTVYTIVGTDIANCTSSPLTVTINVNALPTISLTATSSAICAGQSATLTASGADTYVWSSSANTTGTEVVNPSAQTVYTAQGTNTLTGCNSNVAASYTVNVNALPTAAVSSQTNVTCFGDANGTVILSSSSTNTNVIEPTTGLAAGNYTFTITDLTTTCSNTVTVTIAAPTASLAISSVATQTAACATANGSATITAIDGWGAPYTYSVNGTGTTGSVVTGLQANNYTAQVSDALGCVSTTTFAIVNPNAPVLSIASNTAVICSGQSVTLTPTGATNYTLGTTTFTNNVVLTPGATTVVTITGTDASSCTSAPLTVTVTVNALPTISLTASSSSICAGQSATLTASGADTYVWSSSANTTGTEVVNPSVQTIYTAQGTNTLTGCTNSVAATYTVDVNALPTATVVSQSNILCFGQANGSVTLTTTPSSASISSNTSSLSAGVHTFTITDNGCSSIITATITAPSSSLTATVTNTTTNTSCATPNGAFTVTASGGIPSYTYNATNTNTTGVFTGQGTGSQNITIADANGCTFTVSATVPGIATPSISAATQTNVLCNGGNTGAASITVINGTPTYTYTWSNNTGLNSNTQANLPVGPYTVTATDAGSCTVTQAFIITEPSAINAITSNVTAPCVGQPNGAITIEIIGGTPNYNVAWNPTGNVSTSGNTSSINNISEGQYIATITDANSCSYQYPVQLVAADGLGCSLVIPEIFSPNGDGKNDTWEIKGLENYPNNNVTVFNRWGDQVFKAEPYKNDWDGSNTGDKSILGKGALPVGTYYFILDLGNGDKPITGYVQLTK